MNKLTLSLLLTILTMSMATLFTACGVSEDLKKATEDAETIEDAGEKGGDKETPVTGQAAAGKGDTVPSITVETSNISSVDVAFTPPTDWGTSDDGTALTRKGVTLWLFYLKDTAGAKTKKDIITAVGDNAVTQGIVDEDDYIRPTDKIKGVIQLRGNGPYKNIAISLSTRYAFFVRIIHPDSTIDDKAKPKAHEGTLHSRDTVIVRGTTAGS